MKTKFVIPMMLLSLSTFAQKEETKVATVSEACMDSLDRKIDITNTMMDNYINHIRPIYTEFKSLVSPEDIAAYKQNELIKNHREKLVLELTQIGEDWKNPDLTIGQRNTLFARKVEIKNLLEKEVVELPHPLNKGFARAYGESNKFSLANGSATARFGINEKCTGNYSYSSYKECLTSDAKSFDSKLSLEFGIKEGDVLSGEAISTKISLEQSEVSISTRIEDYGYGLLGKFFKENSIVAGTRSVKYQNVEVASFGFDNELNISTLTIGLKYWSENRDGSNGDYIIVDSIAPLAFFLLDETCQEEIIDSAFPVKEYNKAVEVVEAEVVEAEVVETEVVETEVVETEVVETEVVETEVVETENANSKKNLSAVKNFLNHVENVFKKKENHKATRPLISKNENKVKKSREDKTWAGKRVHDVGTGLSKFGKWVSKPFKKKKDN